MFWVHFHHVLELGSVRMKHQMGIGPIVMEDQIISIYLSVYLSMLYLRYKPPSTDTNPTLEDPTPDYMNLLGMIFSMCGLMLKVSSPYTRTPVCH